MTADDIKASTRPKARNNERITDIDSEWFVARLAKIERSMTELGNHLGIAGSQVSRMIGGKRKMNINEANKVARFLGLPVEEVLKHAGLTLADHAAHPMAASQFVGVDGKLTPTGEPVELPADLVARAREAVPFDRQNHVNAALIRAPKGALAIWDDALVLYEDIGSKPPEMGVLSIAKLRDGVTMMGRIQSVKKSGEAVIAMADGEKKTVDLVGASKVLNVIP